MALDNVVCLESFIDNFAIIFENGDCIRELLPKTKKSAKMFGSYGSILYFCSRIECIDELYEKNCNEASDSLSDKTE